MRSPTDRRPRLALPFSIVPTSGAVRLIAGEDFRYTLAGDGIDEWAPALLARVDGRARVAELLETLAAHRRSEAVALLERLYAERVLVDGEAASAHAPRARRIAVSGSGTVAALLADVSDGAGAALPVLCQDRLDFAAALAWARDRRAAAEPWLWISTGAMTRGFISPIFLPDAGPCLACMLTGFAQRSPLPELYDELLAHGRAGGELAAVPFPDAAARVLAALAEWKVAQLALELPSAATYRLQVLEVASMEVSTHRVFADPHCAECGAETR